MSWGILFFIQSLQQILGILICFFFLLKYLSCLFKFIYNCMNSFFNPICNYTALKCTCLLLVLHNHCLCTYLTWMPTALAFWHTLSFGRCFLTRLISESRVSHLLYTLATGSSWIRSVYATVHWISQVTGRGHPPNEAMASILVCLIPIEVCNQDYHMKFNPCHMQGYRTEGYNLYTKWKWQVRDDSVWPKLL